MKIQFKLHGVPPLEFMADVQDSAAAWKLVEILSDKHVVTDRVIDETEYNDTNWQELIK